jgi:hypothetical protein
VASNKWQGQIGQDGGFVVFATVEDGLRAMAKLLSNYKRQGFQTLSAIINKYAPPSENDTTRYVSFVANKVGIAPNAIVTNEMMPWIASAMINMETGQPTTTTITNYLEAKFNEFLEGTQDFVSSPWPWIVGAAAALWYFSKNNR